MLDTIANIKGDVLVKLNADTTMAFYTDTILNNWIEQAYKWAASYRKWPFTERRDISQAYSTSTEAYSYPSDFKSDGIRFLQVGTDRFRKVAFEDYQRYREDNPDGADKIFTDHGRLYYINPKADGAGTVTVWGQYMVADLDLTDHTATTVFSGAEEDGNEAVVNEVISYAHSREKKTNESVVYHQRAVDLLNNLWERMKDEQFGYHSHERGMWDRLDVLGGAMRDDVWKRDQWF